MVKAQPDEGCGETTPGEAKSQSGVRAQLTLSLFFLPHLALSTTQLPRLQFNLFLILMYFPLSLAD